MSDLTDIVEKALRHYHAGERGFADRLLHQALDSAPNQPDVLHLLGSIAYEAGRMEEAEQYLRRAVDAAPANSAFQNSLGAVLQALGRIEEASARCREAVRLAPGDPAALNNLGIVLARQGLNTEAETLFREALQRIPDDPEVLSNLAAVLNRQSRLDEAITCSHRALQHRPDFPQARRNLSNALLKQGQSGQALARLEELALAFSRSPATYARWGDALLDAGQIDRAMEAYRQALRLAPEYGPAHIGLGHALMARVRYQEAAESLRRGLLAEPGNECAHNGLGCLGLCLGDLDEAISRFQRALLLKPNVGFARHNLGIAYLGQGRLDEARTCFWEAVQREPDRASFHGCYVELWLYDPQVTPQLIQSKHSEWAERHASGDVAYRHWENVPDPDRPLRVGYVSPDLRSHAVAYFVEPFLRAHDPARVETFCYSDAPTPDVMTAQLRSKAHAWRDVFGMTTDRLAALICADRIDVLVELAGHTAWNRLALMARKPAPVEVSYLGYPATTGLSQVDYRLGDAITDPPGEPGTYAEELVRLPGCFCCYHPPPTYSPVSELPAQMAGRVTFGSLHRLSKLNASVLDLWCEILTALPSARMLVSRNTLRGEAARRLREQFRRRGVSDERVVFQHTESINLQHLGAYHQIDIALDAFPWNGHTTACESLWMGVPVVALRGDRHSSRMAASVLTACGLSDWVAESREEYVEIAVRRAQDVAGLAALRAGLRSRMAASPLCDAVAFTHSLEDVYRWMWRRWCAGQTAVACASQNESECRPSNGLGEVSDNARSVSKENWESGADASPSNDSRDGCKNDVTGMAETAKQKQGLLLLEPKGATRPARRKLRV